MTELLIPFAVLGWLFVSLLIIGLMTNGKQCAIALDQFVGTCLIADHYADETIRSAHGHTASSTGGQSGLSTGCSMTRFIAPRRTSRK